MKTITLYGTTEHGDSVEVTIDTNQFEILLESVKPELKNIIFGGRNNT